MNAMPLISVVVASRNYGRYIREAIDSVRRQTYTNWELVIIDDGSTDGTDRIVRPYLEDRRIRYFPSNRLGQTRAKNLGFGLTSGRFVAFLDADDVWLPEKLDRQFRIFRAFPHLGVVYCRRQLIGPDGDLQPTPPTTLYRGQLLDRLLIHNSICFSSIMIRRDVLEHVGTFDTQLELGIDFELWLRVGMQYEFDFVDEVLVKYRTGHANLSTRLCDRIASAMSVKRRFLYRRGGDERLQPEQIDASWGSTYRTMGYMMRPMNVGAALLWYARAATMDGNIRGSARSMAACLTSWVKRCAGYPVETPVAAENRPENV